MIQTSVDVGSSVFQEGVLSSALDVDWYAYRVNGNNPSFSIFIPNERPAVNLCVYLQCNGGTLNLSCEGGSIEDEDSHGAPGCCSIGTATKQAYITGSAYCAGVAQDNIYAYVALGSQAVQCAPYTLRVGF